MAFHFDPTFALLPKFSMGFRPVPTSEEEIVLVASYLGVDLLAATSEEKAQELSRELERQNGFLTKNLESDTIEDSKEYRSSKFIRDIVANSRDSRARDLRLSTNDMTRITLSKAAVDNILDDRDVRQRWDGAGSRGVPVIWYNRRSYATSHEGIVTEHGEGFSLSTIEAADVDAAKGVAFASVVVVAGFDILGRQ